MIAKVKRDAFTLPIADLELIQELIMKCMKQGIRMNKSEIIRAGVHALANMNEQDFIKVATELPKIKTGRPAKS